MEGVPAGDSVYITAYKVCGLHLPSLCSVVLHVAPKLPSTCPRTGAKRLQKSKRPSGRRWQPASETQWWRTKRHRQSAVSSPARDKVGRLTTHLPRKWGGRQHLYNACLDGHGP